MPKKSKEDCDTRIADWNFGMVEIEVAEGRRKGGRRLATGSNFRPATRSAVRSMQGRQRRYIDPNQCKPKESPIFQASGSAAHGSFGHKIVQYHM